MKKKLMNYWYYLITSIFCLSIGVCAIFNYVKAESTSYYSTENGPEFYGLTKATIQLNDPFSLMDTRFRIFARDFEDGDVTQKVAATHNVDTSKVGSYEIHYSVTDSHQNKTELTVPIEVVDDTSLGRYYERTLYNLPSVWNLSLAGTHRGNNHDRQILGFYMEAGSKIQIKKVSGDKNLTLTYLNNDSATEKSMAITAENQELVSNYGGVPFIKSLQNVNTPSVIGITVLDDTGIIDLPYYHYQDSEENFFNNWNSKVNSYSVIESEDITVLVPYHDRNKLVKYYGKRYESLDAFLYYWHQAINQYDEFLGLSYNPTDSLDQNVKTKYFVKANVHGAGAAYYGNDHVGVNSNSVAPFFEVNWGGLHEVGHGYQGSLAHNGMELGEVSNNILGHFVQMNSEIYKYTNYWLGPEANNEDSYNKIRLEGKSFNDLNVRGQLYVLINLLNTYDAKETYAKINQIYRRALYNKQTLTCQDAYTLAFHELYHVNIVPYFESWKLKVSDSVKRTVMNDETLSYLKDLTNNDKLSNTIKEDLKLPGKYSLVTQSMLSNYALTGNLKLTISISDINELSGKKIIVQNSQNYRQEITVKSRTITLENLPVGVYEVVLPTPKNNVFDYPAYVFGTVSSKQTEEINLQYQKSSMKTLKDDTVFTFKGLGNNVFATMSFTDQDIIVSTRSTQPHVYFSDTYAKIEIYNLKNELVYQKDYIGNQNPGAATDTISYELGYKIIVTHREFSGRLSITSSYLNQTDDTLSSKKGTTSTYIMGKYGLYTEDEYSSYLAKIDQYASKLEKELDHDVLINKNLETTKKSALLLSIQLLKEEDKKVYLEKYHHIYNGSSPKLLTDTIHAKVGDSINIYQILKATDVEDGEFTLNSNNSTFDDFSTKKAGIYRINYMIQDLDANKSYGVLTLTVEKKEELEEKPSVPNTPNNPENVEKLPTEDVTNKVEPSTPSLNDNEIESNEVQVNQPSDEIKDNETQVNKPSEEVKNNEVNHNQTKPKDKIDSNSKTEIKDKDNTNNKEEIKNEDNTENKKETNEEDNNNEKVENANKETSKNSFQFSSTAKTVFIILVAIVGIFVIIL